MVSENFLSHSLLLAKRGEHALMFKISIKFGNFLECLRGLMDKASASYADWSSLVTDQSKPGIAGSSPVGGAHFF